MEAAPLSTAAYRLAAGLFATFPAGEGPHLAVPWERLMPAARFVATEAGDDGSASYRLVSELVAARLLASSPDGGTVVSSAPEVAVPCPVCDDTACPTLRLPWPASPAGVEALDSFAGFHVDALLDMLAVQS